MKKKIDAVELMRKIRTKLAEKYLNSPDEELKELREKFGHLKKEKSSPYPQQQTN